MVSQPQECYCDGSLNAFAKGDPPRTQIFDIVGRRVYNNKLQFSNKIANLHLGDIVRGVYYLQLTGIDDKVYRFKFVKE